MLEYANCFTVLPIKDLKDVVHIQLLLHTPPIPYLTLYNNSIYCQLYASEPPYICCNKQVIVRHLKEAHSWRQGRRRLDRLDLQLKDAT